MDAKYMPRVQSDQYHLLKAFFKAQFYQSPVLQALPPLPYQGTYHLEFGQGRLDEVKKRVHEYVGPSSKCKILRMCQGEEHDPLEVVAACGSDLIMFELDTTDMHIWMGSETRKDLDKIFSNIKSIFSPYSKAKKNTVLLRNYFYSAGARQFSANIECPTWSEISPNYVPNTRGPLEEFIEKTGNREPGRLVIWYGEPGSGKTFALRSLARRWKREYVFCNITDANNFLEHPDYYYSVIEERTRPVIFILEDAGDNLLAETRKIHGGRMARLLNLTDGLLAQGRKDLFIITFNERLKELDKAVIRPGRCRSWIRFDKFNRTQAEEWLGKELGQKKDSWTLAELYAIKEGRKSQMKQVAEKKMMGFGD